MADVSVTIDGIKVTVPKGTYLIDAARKAGINISNLADLSSLSTAGSGATSGNVDLWAANDGSSVCQMKIATGTTNLTIKWSNVNGTFNINAPANVTSP